MVIYSLICSFKNGSLTRERIRDICAEGSWKLFNELLNSTPRGNFGNIGKKQTIQYTPSYALVVHLSWHQIKRAFTEISIYLKPISCRHTEGSGQVNNTSAFYVGGPRFKFQSQEYLF
jgi:hypothetical protein